MTEQQLKDVIYKLSEQRSADFAALRERYERELAEIAANYEPMLQHLTKRLVQQENIRQWNEERGLAA